MLPREQLERLRAAASRLLAVIEHDEIVRRFKADWTTSLTAGERFEMAVDRLNEAMKEVDA